jgi:hypothetical protein
MSQDSDKANKEESIYDRFPPPLGQSKNPTDWNIDAFSSPDLARDSGPFHLKEWQRNPVVKDSKESAGMPLYSLVFIMAKDECYIEMLPELWDYSGFNNDGRQRFPQWDPLFATDRKIRLLVWYWLLCRWTIFEKYIDENQSIESYYFSHLKKIPLLALYEYINGEFEPIKEKSEPIQSPKHYIKLREFEDYIKRIADSEEAEISIPLPASLYPGKAQHDKNENLQSIEFFLQNIRIYYENDYEIKIQEPRKGAKTTNHTTLGFKNNRTKQWKAFIELLQKPAPLFNAGPAGASVSPERKIYESKIKLLNEINKKLIKFLNQNYSISIPVNYKLYEKCPKEATGAYKFKFFVGNEKTGVQRLEQKFKEMNDDQLKKGVEDLADKYRKTSDNSVSDEFIAAYNVLENRRILTDKELKEMIEPIKPKEEYRFDKFENVEDLKED